MLGGVLAALVYKFVFDPYRSALSYEDAKAKLCKLHASGLYMYALVQFLSAQQSTMLAKVFLSVASDGE